MTSRHPELAHFDASLPIERAATPPSSWYTSPGIESLEQRTVFARNWLAVARRDQLGQPSAYVAEDIAGEPFVVTRDPQDRLRAFYNVCRHHAATLVDGTGCADSLVCPYHGWTYGLDGRLLKAPGLGAIENFEPAENGLVEVAAAGWSPLVFICAGERPRDLPADLEPLGRQLDSTGWQQLRFVESRRYELACNWKVYVDNYLDGGYHVPHLHGGLAGQLDLDSYTTELGGRFSIQRATAGGSADSARDPVEFRDRIGDGAVYAWVYPNLMINRYGPVLDTNRVLPLGVDRCEVVFDWYFDTPVDEAFIERSLAASEQVQREDTLICESVQRGLNSRAYDRGRYSALKEQPMYHFHQLLAADLAESPG